MKRIVKGAVSLVLLLLIAAAVAGAASQSGAQPESVIDDETVYGILQPDGTLKSAIVVDWLRVRGHGTVTVRDSGTLDGITYLKHTPEAEIQGSELVWNIDVDGYRDLYYRTETSKELPVDFDIAYYLDGKEVSYDELKGASGHMKIVVNIKNKLEKTVPISYESADGTTVNTEETIYTPLFVVANLNLDAEKFDNVDPVDGSLSVQGSNFVCSWYAFPQGESEIVLEADGRDIEIGQFILSAVPQLPQEVSLDMASQFKDLYDGLNGLKALSEGHQLMVDEMVKQLDSADYSMLADTTSGISELKAGIDQTGEGVDGLAMMAQGQIEFLNQLIDSLESQDTSSLGQLSSSIDQLLRGVQLTKDGIDGLVLALQGQQDVLVSLKNTNDYLAVLAADAASRNTTDTTIASIVTNLSVEQSLIDILLNGGELVPGSPLPGITSITASLQEISDGLDSTIYGLQLLKDSASDIEQLGVQLDELTASLKVLRDGGLVQGVEMPGLTALYSGLTGVSSGLGEISSGIGAMESGMSQLDELPEMMAVLTDSLKALRDGGVVQGQYVPGISTTVESLEMMKDGVGTGLDEMRRGEAVQDAMKEQAELYSTFLGTCSEPEYESRVRFIFKVQF